MCQRGDFRVLQWIKPGSWKAFNSWPRFFQSWKLTRNGNEEAFELWQTKGALCRSLHCIKRMEGIFQVENPYRGIEICFIRIGGELSSRTLLNAVWRCCNKRNSWWFRKSSWKFCAYCYFQWFLIEFVILFGQLLSINFVHYCRHIQRAYTLYPNRSKTECVGSASYTRNQITVPIVDNQIRNKTIPSASKVMTHIFWDAE